MRNNTVPERSQKALQDAFFDVLQANLDKSQIKNLLDAGLDLNQKINETSQQTVFQGAIEFQADVSIIQQLITHDKTVLQQQYHNTLNIVEYAAIYGCPPTVNFLKENGLGFTAPTAEAAYEGNITALERLDSNQINKDHVLHYAVAGAIARNDLTLLRLLVSLEGININLTSEDGATPVYTASAKGHLDVVRTLLAAGANIHLARTVCGTTPLYAASCNGHTDVVSLLLKSGASVHRVRTANKITPLYAACKNGYSKVANLLIKSGADVNQASVHLTVTPLWIASNYGHVTVVRELLKSRAQINKAKTDTGSTPLWIASFRGYLEVVRVLLDGGANVHKARTDNGATPLYAASYYGHAEVVRLLIERGAKVNQARTDTAGTPLNVASQNGHVEVVRTLLISGADINKSRKKNGPPLDAASYNGHAEIIRLLLNQKEKRAVRQKKSFLFRVFSKKETVELNTLHAGIDFLHPKIVRLLLLTPFYYKNVRLDPKPLKQKILANRNRVKQSTELSEERKARPLCQLSQIAFLLFLYPASRPVGFPIETDLDRNMLREGFFHTTCLPPDFFKLLNVLRYAKQDVKNLQGEVIKQNMLWCDILIPELWFDVLTYYLYDRFPFLLETDEGAIHNIIEHSTRSLEKRRCDLLETDGNGPKKGAQTTTVSALMG